MLKRRVILILLGLVVAGAIVVLCRREREPEYGGKRLSEWVEMLAENYRQATVVQMNGKEEAEGAIRKIGTNAIPDLLEWVRYEKRLPLVRAEAAGSLASLGTNALPAVPALIQCIQDTNRVVAVNAVSILGIMKLQPELVVPALVNTLHHPRMEFRCSAASALGRFGDRAHTAVPALLSLLKDPNPRVRDFATNALHKIDPDALGRTTP